MVIAYGPINENCYGFAAPVLVFPDAWMNKLTAVPPAIWSEEKQVSVPLILMSRQVQVVLGDIIKSFLVGIKMTIDATVSG